MLRKLDNTRLKILEILTKPMTTTEIARKINLSKSTVSHHLKILLDLRLVKVERIELEKNFIKKYYVSTLNMPNHLFPDIFKGVKLSDREFLRALLRSFALLNLENGIFLRKVGLDVGYYLLANNVEDERVHESVADLWEKLRLGNVIEVTPKSFVVEDCYMCSNLPPINDTYCKTDEGILEGILLKKTGVKHLVREIRCWGTGDEKCEFKIEKLNKN